MKTSAQDYCPIVNNAPYSRRPKSGRAGFFYLKVYGLVLGFLPSIAVGALCLPPSTASAETFQAGGVFSSRRVAPPDPSSSRRITVQIDPDAEPFRITPPSEPRRPGDPRPEAALVLPEDLIPDAVSPFDWYWEAVSPVMGLDPATRFRDAITAIERSGTRIPSPRLQTLRNITDRHGVDILTSTIGTNVSPALVLAVIAIESAGRTDAVSHAGAEGLMQLIPATASRFDVGDSMNPSENIRGGVAYLDWLLREFKGDVVLALAGYNAGEGAVAKHSGVPPFAETRAYVPKVLAAWNMARSLCLTPPDLISDGCVFVASNMTAQTE